jgi:hypothetical protein
MYIVYFFISLIGITYPFIFLLFFKVFINWKCFFIESNLINQSKTKFLNACDCLIKNDITTFKWQLIIFYISKLFTLHPTDWLFWNTLRLSRDTILAVGGVQDRAVRKEFAETDLRNVCEPRTVVF